ncbi:MAG: dienelactone hydrolase [Omnitrophica WOR_2 bacterium GWF2_43_52]|nr:MAG: dienelactone hydrolase [Omnitrophica WOR_2 bacterium GWF2_43_52]OGX55490.1 MAG: dienelactone hydrolase [Omnitrophica WOR_2 bacterium RIFOXYC2_FULL_43_9]HAH21733.1 dienelactone hydrolase [Candidatus Omnitrophota bacterium]HBG64720.1 dienelactone hydrolase [Candidatus Omnitrophota bacterium]HCD37873.1 dienelactone hydrolase [Candidatus Omnitrophota bacterium]
MKKIWCIVVVIISVVAFRSDVIAGIHTETVEYKDNEVILEGYLAYDDALKNKAPGVLIVHEWTGIGPYVMKRAQQVAALGYVVFCADIYGKGIRPKDAQEASEQASRYKVDRKLMRQRVTAGLERLRRCEFVDSERIAAVGYCFGGTTVLELARGGAQIQGVVSFHGGLDTPSPEETKAIKAKILVLHGADDPFISTQQISAFQDEMRGSHADWQMVSYGNAVHSFTNADSGADPKKGVAYNQEADTRSWKAMEVFLNELFS